MVFIVVFWVIRVGFVSGGASWLCAWVGGIGRAVFRLFGVGSGWSAWVSCEVVLVVSGLLRVFLVCEGGSFCGLGLGVICV